MDQIGRYHIVGELGRGAMGVVYHATDPSIGRSVAIKTIRILDINDTQQRNRLRERLFREARSAGVLSHPNIVTIYDMDEVDGLAYIAMAYVNGPTLEKILASEAAISGAKMLRILRQAAAALDYAHSKGIVHRDVKPANIMTDEDGSVKITDFGIAKITEDARSTETRTVAGTPNYMSPEQVQGFTVDGRSDQFSLAVIAYEILTGERPFIGEHLSTIVFKIVAEEPPPAPRINSTLTPQIDEVLRKGLAKKPEDRYPNCSNFVGALELACAESRGWKTLPAGTSSNLPTLVVDNPRDLAPALPPPPFATMDEPRRRTTWLPLLLSILVVAGVAAIFVYQSGLVGESPKPQVIAQQQPQPVVDDKHADEKQPPSETPDADPKPAEAKPAEQTPPDASTTQAVTTQVVTPEPEKPKPLPPAEKTEPPVAKPERSPHKEEAPRTRIAAAPRVPRSQDIWITSNPPGAKAVLDGNLAQSCTTPCMLHGTTGMHHLSLSKGSYINEYRDLPVGDTAVDFPQITLQQPEGTLFLSTDPAGATIRINGKLTPQMTPAKITLSPGSYSITVEKNGAAKTETVQVRDGMVRVSISLGQ